MAEPTWELQQLIRPQNTQPQVDFLTLMPRALLFVEAQEFPYYVGFAGGKELHLHHHPQPGPKLRDLASVQFVQFP